MGNFCSKKLGKETIEVDMDLKITSLFTFDRLLGSGTVAKVYMIVHIKSGLIRAVKCIPKNPL